MPVGALIQSLGLPEPVLSSYHFVQKQTLYMPQAEALVNPYSCISVAYSVAMPVVTFDSVINLLYTKLNLISLLKGTTSIYGTCHSAVFVGMVENVCSNAVALESSLPA